MRKPQRKRRLLVSIAVMLAVVGIGFALPEHASIPVAGATSKDWNAKSFWYEPWGASGVHKGIDIFAVHGQPVISAVPGVVLYRGQLGLGGNVAVVIGPKWRLHYYAHLAEASSGPTFVRSGSALGAVGSSGNAAGKPPHLHYAVLSLVPIPWRYSAATQGWKQMFFLDPAAVLAPGH